MSNEAVRQQAESQRKTANDLITEWVSEKGGEAGVTETSEAFAREIAAFEALKPALLKQYPEQYVAIYQEQVVGHGNNRLALVKEVYNLFGEVPCFVEKVSLDPLRRVRITSVWKAK
jgi:hypothetical protein